MSQIALAYPYDSELVEAFDYHLQKMKQSGVLHKLQIKWGLVTDIQNKEKDEQFVTEAEVLGFHHVLLGIVFILGGIGLSILCLLLEKLFVFLKAYFGIFVPKLCAN